MNTFSCKDCGVSLRRAKRRRLERLRYLETYRCPSCDVRYHLTIGLRLRLARWAKCPGCRFQGVKALKRIDTVDRMRSGIFNFLYKIMGGQLYYCWFCRLQFYDLRPRLDNPEWREEWLKGGKGTSDRARSR